MVIGEAMTAKFGQNKTDVWGCWGHMLLVRFSTEGQFGHSSIQLMKWQLSNSKQIRFSNAIKKMMIKVKIPV